LLQCKLIVSKTNSKQEDFVNKNTVFATFYLVKIIYRKSYWKSWKMSSYELVFINEIADELHHMTSSLIDDNDRQASAGFLARMTGFAKEQKLHLD